MKKPESKTPVKVRAPTVRETFCKRCPKKKSCRIICPALSTHLRSKTRENVELLLSPTSFQFLIEAHSFAQPISTPESILLAGEAIDSLSRSQRDVLRLHIENGIAIADISRILGMARATVRTHLKRAVEKISSYEECFTPHSVHENFLSHL